MEIQEKLGAILVGLTLLLVAFYPDEIMPGVCFTVAALGFIAIQFLKRHRQNELEKMQRQITEIKDRIDGLSLRLIR